jgi:uncharacterized protein YkwD
MRRFLLAVFIAASPLASCISISVETEAPAAPVAFITSTLPPTRPGFVPVTLTPLPPMTRTATLSIASSAGCRDSAVLLEDVTIPDNTQVAAGQKFTKTWRFQNTGTCPWAGYTLGFAAGDQMGAPLSAPIPDALPGGRVDVSVELTAPSTDGAYTGYFTLNNREGLDVPIGIEKTFWVKIIVGRPSPNPSTAATGAPSGSTSAGTAKCTYSTNAGYVIQLLSLINQARAGNNLPSLTVNAQLAAAAQAHSEDMSCNNFLGHTGSNGSDIGARIRAAGFTGYYLEIIAIGTPQNAMDQWADDAPHWDAVLAPSVTEVGVGYAYNADSDYGGYWTVDMGGQ